MSFRDILVCMTWAGGVRTESKTAIGQLSSTKHSMQSGALTLQKLAVYQFNLWDSKHTVSLWN